MKTFGIDLKVASKIACGASITDDKEIVIQGDFKNDFWDLVPEKWPIEVRFFREIVHTQCVKMINL